MNIIKKNSSWLLLCCFLTITHAVTHVLLDESQTYRAWTAPETRGRCAVESGNKSTAKWSFKDVKGASTDELLADPCAYQITCPDISTYDEGKLLCSIEPDWNRNLSTCALASTEKTDTKLAPKLCNNPHRKNRYQIGTKTMQQPAPNLNTIKTLGQ
jgi:hypothetical protein